jgi:ferrous iron transport protein B
MSNPVAYPLPIEAAIAQIEAVLSEQEPLQDRYGRMSARSLALLLLQDDAALWQQLQLSDYQLRHLTAIVTEAQQQQQEPLSLTIALARQRQARQLEQAVLIEPSATQLSLTEWLHRLTVNPITGFPLLLIILYYGIYQFVGQFGAGVLVDAIETFFETQINPVVNQVTALLLPWQPLQDLVANDYGIITLGLRYAIAIVLPVVTTYFLMFSLLEDSGYLPRLSLMLDRLFKTIGLSGRAVIPMVLGLGCDTMATVVTRTLETKRERIIATFLLSLAVPCAAQWGVILGLLSQNPMALLIWGGFILSIFLVMGYLTSRILPGKKADFYMEVPPLRLPSLRNVLIKTYVRMKWYLWEIIPLFVWASVLIWLGRLTGLFDLIVKALEPIALGLGLPASVAPVFLYGFFRRDYGAAGLFDLQQQGGMTGNQLLVAAVVLTLFLPCVAQLQVMVKERGLKTTLIMVSFIVPFAFLMGYVMNGVLSGLGVML